MAVASPELGHAAAGVGEMDGTSAIAAEGEEGEKAEGEEEVGDELESEEAKEEDGCDEEEEEEEGAKWLKHYIGDGDFSFSRALAIAFCSAENLVSTSLDSYEALRSKYAKAESNIMVLKMMGATTLHGVDAKTMKHHTDLKMRRFDQIVFNLPHAGFKGKEDSLHLINLPKDLVRGFFQNARHLLRPSEKVDFHIEDYPGYNHKRGDGPRCDEPFALGPCSTFKFSIRNLKKKKKGPSNRISSVPSLGGSHVHVHPEILASDWSPSQPFRPMNAVNTPVTLYPSSLRIAQRHQPGFPVNFVGLHTLAACSLQQGTIHPRGHSNRICSFPSLEGSYIHPGIPAFDWSSSQPFHPVNSVNMSTLDPYSLRVAQRHQPGFPVNFVGLQTAAAYFLQQGNIHPMVSIARPSPYLLPIVGGIASPMGRITGTSLIESQKQPRSTLMPWQSVSSSYMGREYQMNLRRGTQ
uniref:25S rRNA (uridine-N(3))-methyltransferase BMT5-like domain-containing protein n=1 Tax=Leersia perrieri TaxID=77586 RepID=A0A0D9XEW2_9ORYZ